MATTLFQHNFMSAAFTQSPSVRHTSRVGRVALAATALLALLLWYVITAAPFTFIVVYGLLWMGAPLLWVATAGVLTFLFMAWLTTPNGHLHGDVVSREQVPGLFATLDELQSELSTPPIHRVLMTDDLNAGAYQSGVLGLPLFSRQTLLLGWPLLAVLSASEAKAVVAHELGHFSRRHGLWGHWIYRARLYWMLLDTPADADDSPFDRGVQWFANRFAPWFAAKTYPYARACEFEADHEAASAASGHDLVSALLRLDVASQRLLAWESWQWPRQLSRDDVQILQPFQAMTQAAAVTAFTEHDGQAALSRLPRREDTHPTIAQRAHALQVDVQRVTALVTGAPSAGQEWCGARWLQHVAVLDRKALAAQGPQWAADQIHLRQLAERAVHLGDETADFAWAQCLSANRQLGDRLAMETACSRMALRSEHSSLWLRWELWTYRLDCGIDVARAVRELEAVVAADPAFAVPVRQRLLDHAEQTHDDAALGKQQTLLSRAQRRLDEAVESVHRAVESGRLKLTSLCQAALAAFSAQLSADTCVQGVWLGEAEGASEDGRHFTAHVLVLHVDAPQMALQSLGEDGLSERYARQLRRWRQGPQELVVVRVCFLAEKELPAILNKTPAWRWVR